MIALKARLTATMRCWGSVIITPSAVLSNTVAACWSFSCMSWRSVMSRAMVSRQGSSPTWIGWMDSSQRRIWPSRVRIAALRSRALPCRAICSIIPVRSAGLAQTPSSRVERPSASLLL
ncbi:hypothetical protein D3C86_1323070 [compost metagenome]